MSSFNISFFFLALEVRDLAKFILLTGSNNQYRKHESGLNFLTNQNNPRTSNTFLTRKQLSNDKYLQKYFVIDKILSRSVGLKVFSVLFCLKFGRELILICTELIGSSVGERCRFRRLRTTLESPNFMKSQKKTFFCLFLFLQGQPLGIVTK